MALPNAAYYENIRHTLSSIHKPDLIITDPIGYETADEEFVRTIENIGIVTNYSTSLKFVNDGLDYILDVVKNYGINEVVSIKKEGQDPNTDEWVELYTSTLETILNHENDELAVKINSGGFDKLFKARESEKLEIESTTTIDQITIPELVTKDLTIDDREIFLTSSYEVSDNDDTAYMYNYTDDKGNERGSSVCVPLFIKSKSHENAQNPYPNTKIGDRFSDGTNEMMFFANSNVARVLNMDLAITFTPDVIRNENTDFSRFWFRIAIYKNGTDYDYDREIVIWYADNISTYDEIVQTFNVNEVLNLGAGESASLQFSQLLKGGSGTRSRLEITCRDINVEMILTESSTFATTSTKAITLHDLGERLSQLITGKSNRFKSSILGRTELGYSQDGEFAYLSAYSGHWLRNFGLADELYKKFTTSFKDYTQTLQSVLNVHVGFQSINNQDLIIAEDFEYFFNPNIVIVLPTPLANVKEYTAEDFVFSSVELGYEKGGEVEGIMGLDEPNGKANWVSNITAIKNPYSSISKYIAGVYDEEKQRRYQREDYPTLDTDRDTDIFIKDCKAVSGVLTERLWNDDFAAAPTGIFSPETAKNLRLSPANNLRRRKSLLATPLKHYQNEYLSFGSSTANSAMTTQLIGKAAITENDNIINSDLGNRLFEPYYIEGEHVVSNELMTQLKGFTNINGVDVPNFYCKVEFTIEGDATVRHGYIMSVKPDGAGTWKFIEAAFEPIPVDPEYPI